MDQSFEKIKIEDVLNRSFYPSWFFTNEKIGDFLRYRKNKIEKGFCIGGGGDFTFNMLSFSAVKEIYMCDVRPVACFTIDLKRTIFKNFSLKETEEMLTDYKRKNKSEIYNRIKSDINPLSKKFFEKVLQTPNENFISSLKNSGYWYKNSFWQFKKNYLFYLKEERFNFLKENLENTKIHCGEFKEELSKCENDSYDLIYISNIFDSQKECSDEDGLSKIIEKKLTKKGVLVLATQKSVKKVVEKVESVGLQKKDIKIHKCRLITLFTKHYPYSFIIFEK